MIYTRLTNRAMRIAYEAHREQVDKAGAPDRLDGAAAGGGSPAASDDVSSSYRFFNNAACAYRPCHDMPADQINCLFCFCPLYALGPDCGGDFTYVGEQGDIKDCSACTVPHRRENYDYIMERFADIQRLAAPRREGDGADAR